MIRKPSETKRLNKGQEYTFSVQSWSYMIVPNDVKVSVNRGAFTKLPAPFTCNATNTYSFSKDCIVEVGTITGKNEELSIIAMGSETVSKGDKWIPSGTDFNAIRIPNGVTVSIKTGVHTSDFIDPLGKTIEISSSYSYIFSDDVIISKFKV